MGDGGLDLLHRDGKIILAFERSPDQRAMASLQALFVGGMAAALLYGAVYAILYADPSRSALMAPFFIICAGVAPGTASMPCLSLITLRCSTRWHVRSRGLK